MEKTLTIRLPFPEVVIPDLLETLELWTPDEIEALVETLTEVSKARRAVVSGNGNER